MDGLPDQLLEALPGDGIRFVGKQAMPGFQIPATSRAGAYLLLIRLAFRLEVNLKNRSLALPPGWVLYAGSARGPGGMAARVQRHLRARKKIHWHIDKITTRVRPTAAFCYPDRCECDLVRDLLLHQEFSFPIPGFGSTDCRVCESHLLSWNPDQ